MQASLAILVLLLDVHRAGAAVGPEPSVDIEQLETDDATDAQVWLLDDATVVVWLSER